MRIGVIEEVDEQMTLTSLRQSNESRPHVQSIFTQGPPPPSDPVDVPGVAQSYNREIFSRSAPARAGALIIAGSAESAVEKRNILRLIIYKSEKSIPISNICKCIRKFATACMNRLKIYRFYSLKFC